MTPAAPDVVPSRVLRNEHTTWITQDRHANAYQVLFSRRSRAMESMLTGGTLEAHKDARCLACHSWSGADPVGVSAEVVRQDGVGCESCHGAAEHWLGAHTQAWWNSLNPADKQARFGMRATKALDQRVGICVECHVGAPGREVNHDLIAAGHPRLNFEFAAFLANMPPHWFEDTRGNFPAQAWAIGQVATARAALDQLHGRALQVKATRDNPEAAQPWPEFSEYDCFSCHHDLADEKWRKPGGGPGHTPGTPTWGSWYYPMTFALAASDPRAGSVDLDAQLAAISKEMNSFAPDPAKVAGQTRELAGELTRWLHALAQEARSYDGPKLKVLIKAVESRDSHEGATGWDVAAQRYLALQPLRMALKGLDPRWDDTRLKAELDRSFGLLQFPRGFDSPRRFDPAILRGGR